MKTIYRLGDMPAGAPLLSDDLIEFHAARLLLLLNVTGTKNRIDGLTKLAKLDFFVRYPRFFNRAAAESSAPTRSAAKTIESSMIRHHYGPWDKRYYDVLGYLESRRLITIYKTGNTFRFELTKAGIGVANNLKEDPSYHQLVEQMTRVRDVFGKVAGSSLKKLIYRIFDEEVARKPLGEVIK